jgi:hypothetical protein
LPTNLIDALVSVQGACTSELNVRRQLSGITLHVPSLEQIKILEPAPADPFAIGTTRIDAVATFDPDRFAGRRVKIQGVVTLRMTGQGFIVQDASGGMRVLTRQTNEVHLGDLVEAIGFPAIGDFSPYLEEAAFRTLGTGPMPAPKPVTAEQILLHGTKRCANRHDGRAIVAKRAALGQSANGFAGRPDYFHGPTRAASAPPGSFRFGVGLPVAPHRRLFHSRRRGP